MCNQESKKDEKDLTNNENDLTQKVRNTLEKYKAELDKLEAKLKQQNKDSLLKDDELKKKIEELNSFRKKINGFSEAFDNYDNFVKKTAGGSVTLDQEPEYYEKRSDFKEKYPDYESVLEYLKKNGCDILPADAVLLNQLEKDPFFNFPFKDIKRIN